MVTGKQVDPESHAFESMRMGVPRFPLKFTIPSLMVVVAHIHVCVCKYNSMSPLSVAQMCMHSGTTVWDTSGQQQMNSTPSSAVVPEP